MRKIHFSSPSSDVCVIVLTSEVTWTHLSTYCFNSNFVKSRSKFDLCVAFNGEPTNDALAFLAEQNANHAIIRPNFGMDPAALDECLKNLPSYEYYIVLHDDHWFSHDKWFEYLLILMKEDPTVAAYGNLVTSCPYSSPEYEKFFDIVSSVIGYEGYGNAEFNCFLQGMAGIFRRSAIEQLLLLDGVPHTHGNHKKTVEVCERLFSYAMLRHGAIFKQIPPGYELYLRHRHHNHSMAEAVAS